MQVKSIAGQPVILLTFIKLPFVIKILVFCVFLSGHLTQVLLYVPVNNLQYCWDVFLVSWVEPVLSRGYSVLRKDTTQ